MDKISIPILDLSPEIEMLWDELQTAIQGVLRSGHFIMGPQVKAFEEEIAAYLGVRHAIGLNSGTDALFISLKALGIGPGDEVITSPFTFFATAEAVSHVGATPVFVDVDLKTYNLDVTQVEAAISPRTKAIIPVHIFGQPTEMDDLLAIAAQHGLQVIEDVAQGFGAEYKGRKAGSIGLAGAFSFFPTKNLGAYGDGGLLVTNDDRFAEVCRMLRAHGSKKKYHNELVGYNSRLDELQAAILRVKLRRIDEWNEGRRQVAERYSEWLGNLPGLVVPQESASCKHVYHQYTVRVCGGRRRELQEQLQAAGIGTMVYYPVPVHRLPVYGHPAGQHPVAEKLAGEVLSLPIWPLMTADVQERVAIQVAQCLQAGRTQG